MKNKSILVLIIIFVSIKLFSQQSNIMDLKGPYFGQKLPGMIPEIFAPGIISVPEAKYTTITFSGNSDEFYFYRWDDSVAKIYFCKIENGFWTQPKEVDFTKGFKPMEPLITVDSKRIYFIWDKPVPEGEQETPFKIWFTDRTKSGWSKPSYAGVGMYLSTDKDGNIYTTDMTSVLTTGKTYLAKVNIENGKFIGYEKLQIPEYYGSQAHPCIAPDGSYIIFDVDSGHHLFVSFKKKDKSWSDAIDLTNHSFDIMSGGASITPDGKYLFFNLKGQLMWVDIRVINDLKNSFGLQAIKSKLKSNENLHSDLFSCISIGWLQ